MQRLAISALVACGFALTFAGPAAAQGRHVFLIDSNLSPFTFSGSITLGVTANIVGQPNTFKPSGQASADVTVAGGAITAGRLVTGNSTVIQIPTLNAIVPSPIPFLPPLASVQVTGVQMIFTSVDPTTLAPASFAVAGNGSFSTSVVANVLAGSAVVTGLINQTVALGGLQSPAAPVSGTLAPTTTGMRLTVPVSATFSFTEPNSGATGSLTFNGSVVANDRPLAANVDSISLGTGGVQP